MLRLYKASLVKVTVLPFIAWLFVMVGLTSCSDDSQDKSTKPVRHSLETVFEKSDASTEREHSGAISDSPVQNDKNKSLSDWGDILHKGELRILVLYTFQHNEFLPIKTIPYNHELNLILRFSEAHNLTPVIITVKNFSAILSSLEQGLGDVVIANLTITESRQKKVNFTVPVSHTVEQLVVANTNNKKISLQHLDGIKIGVRPNTSFWETITAIKEQQNTIQIIPLNDKITEDEKLNKLVAGEIEAVFEDSNRLSLITEYRKDIKVALDLGKERPIAWAVRKNNPQLLKQLNRYIKTEKLLQHLPVARQGDFDTIKKNHQLRLITRNNASTYFLWKNQLMGFEYELIKKFAQQLKINLKVMVANDYKQMIEWLEQGYGDIISAGLIKTSAREKLPIQFTEPYLFVQEMIVQRKNEQLIESPRDLHQRTFYVRKSSSNWNTLSKLQQQLKADEIHFSIETVPEAIETEEIIKAVIDKKYDLTLADSHIIAIEKSWQSNIQASLSLTGELGHRWLLRSTDKKLLLELNKFIKKQYKGLFYNVTYNKFFKNSRNLFDAEGRESSETRISEYDELIKSLATEYHV